MKLLLALALAGSASADEFKYNRASTAAPFLRIAAGARASAMGEAYTAVASDASAVFWNPAGLTEVARRSATFSHSEYLDSISFDHGAYAHSLGDFGALGASVHYLSAGQLTEMDEAGVEQGTFRPHDLAVSLAYGYRFKARPAGTDSPFERADAGFEWLNGWSAGAAVKYVRSQIVLRDEAVSFDAGLLSPWWLGRRLRLGLAAHNIGGVLRYDSEREILPLAAKAGLAMRWSEAVLTTLEGVWTREAGPHAALGAEYRLRLDGPWSVAARGGLNSRTLAEVSGATGFTAGLGLGYLDFELDYSFLPVGTLGAAHQFSVSAKF